MGPREWTLAELQTQFPVLSHRDVGFVCERRVDGRGRWIKSTAGRAQFGDVVLHVEPGEGLTVRFSHQWPGEVDPALAEELDQGLLRGIVEGLHLQSPHLGDCRIITETGEFKLGETTPQTVSLAAQLAISDLLKKGGWVGHDPEPGTRTGTA